MLKKVLCMIVVLSLIMGLTPACAQEQAQKYSKVYFDLFDSVITIIGYTTDSATFDRVAEQARARFEHLHQLFDQYHEYEGVNNVYIINRDACVEPVAVEDELFSLLQFVKREQPRLMGSVNIAMGGVLAIWHEYRLIGTEDPQSAVLPPIENLKEAAKHQSLDAIVLDEQNRTVFITDPAVQLDLGAVAKGYAAELVAKELEKGDMPSFIINAGGNVITGSKPLDGRSSWSVGIQDPRDPYGAALLDTVAGNHLSVVTSGDYQRFYYVDGVKYAHIISPDTLMPADLHQSVTVVAADSGLCDMLSTALFVLSYEDGLALLKQYPDVGALWLTTKGEILHTQNIAPLLKSNGTSDQ